MQKKRILLFFIGLVLLLIGCVGFALIQTIISYLVQQKMAITPSSPVYSQFTNPTVPVLMQVFMYNLTNPVDVLQGEKPILHERGPYTYREIRHKWDIAWRAEYGSVVFKQNKTFLFDESQSVGSDLEVFTSANLPLVSLINGIRFQTEEIAEKISYLLRLFPNETLFIEKSVRDFVWGYEDPLLKLGNIVVPKIIYQPCIGILAGNNNTFDGTYEVVTGVNDISRLGTIITFNGTDELKFWSTPEANQIKGSDGSLWPPFMNKNKQLDLFTSQICRSLPLKYSADATIGNPSISALRFSTPIEMFYNATVNPDNVGFCTPDANHCVPQGLLNITTCRFIDGLHVPIVTSNPHFLFADEEVLNAVIGLHPVLADHNSFIDIEPTTGALLRARSLLQVNAYIEFVPGFHQMGNITTVYFPILWFNESVVANDDVLNLLYSQLFTPKWTATIMLGVITAIAPILMLASLFACRSRNNAYVTIQ